MNFFGALGGVGQGVTAGINDLQDMDAAQQRKDENALRMKQIQMGIDKDLRNQDAEAAYRKELKSYQSAQARYDAEFKAQQKQAELHNAAIKKTQADPELPDYVAPQMVDPSTVAQIATENIAAPLASNASEGGADYKAQPETEARPTINIAPETRHAISTPKPMEAPKAPRQAGFHDELLDMVNLAKIDVKHGKASHSSLMPLISTLKNAEDEGMSKSLQVALTGDLEGAKRMFESTGAMRDASGVRFEKSKFDPGNGMKPIDSVVAIMPNGQRIDAAGALWAKRQAEDIIGTYINQEKVNIDRERAGTEKTKVENDDKHHTGTLAETSRHNRAAEGIDRAKAAKEAKPKYNVDGSNVATVLGDPAVDKKGKPMMDMMTGRQAVNRNPAREAEFYQWMAQNGITDTNEGLAQFMGKSIAQPETPAANPVAAEQPTLTQKLRTWASETLGKSKPTQSQNTTAKPAAPPSVGEVRSGYKFKGGDPRVKENWESVKPQNTASAKQQPTSTQPAATKITVGAHPLPLLPNGDKRMADIPRDGKFYQNVIYRDGNDRFEVDANGNRKEVGASTYKKTSKG